MKKYVGFISIFLVLLLLAGCQASYSKHSETFFDTFDTVTKVVGYTKTEAEFEEYATTIKQRLKELHKLYDIYNNYEGINNIKTINDNAGIKPVEVEQEIIDLLLLSKDWYQRTNGKFNISMGPVFKIWHNYRDDAEYDPALAAIPPMEDLQRAAEYAQIDKVIIDEENKTVFLAEEDMRLDVGAVAKGYAVELATQEAIKEGFTSGIVSPGGNVRTIGKPLQKGQERWGIGIQNPESFVLGGGADAILETLFVNDAAIVSSGDYQRYYIVDGKIIHHLIDPDTLMPAEHYRAVTVVTDDSGLADIISTATFLMPYDESRAFIEGMENVEAMWVFYDGTVQATEGMQAIMQSHGATSGKAD